MFVCSHRGATPARRTEARNRKKEHMSENVDTICVQGGYQPGNGESRTPPIIQATTFKYQSSEQMSRLFDLSESGYFYTRLQNPTNDTVAAKICELEGGAAAMLTRPARRRTSSRCSTSATTATTSSPPPPSTAHVQPHQRDHAQDGRRMHLRQPGLHRRGT